MTKKPYVPKGIVYDDIPPLPPGWVRVADHKERWEKMRAEARQEADRLARHLGEKWNVRRVWLYGSVAGVWNFTEWSDIDLAAEGLTVANEFEAKRDLEAIRQMPLRIDLRRREEWPDERWNRLIPTPVLLFERAAAETVPPA